MNVPFVIVRFVPLKFVAKKLVDVAFVVTSAVPVALRNARFVEDAKVEKKRDEVAFVPLKFVAKKFVDVAFVEVLNKLESCVIEDDALTAMPTVVVGVSAERSASFTQSGDAPPAALPQAVPVFEISPTAENVAQPAVPPAFETMRPVVEARPVFEIEKRFVVAPFWTDEELMLKSVVKFDDEARALSPNNADDVDVVVPILKLPITFRPPWKMLLCASAEVSG